MKGCDVFQPEHIAVGKLREDVVCRAVADDGVESEQGLEDNLPAGKDKRRHWGVTELQVEYGRFLWSTLPSVTFGTLPVYGGSSHPRPPPNPTSQTPRNLPRPVPHPLSRYPPPSSGSFQTSKVPIQEFADKVAGIFIPIVLSVATFTFIVGWLLTTSLMILFSPRYISLPWLLKIRLCIFVIVVACPSATMAGIGVGAQNRILI